MRQKGLQELLLVTAGKRMDIYSKVCCCLDFFLVAVLVFFCWFVPFLWTALKQASAGQLVVAACRGERNQNKTHKFQFALFENALSTHIQQECCFFLHCFGCFPPCLVGNNHCRVQTHFVCFKSSVVVDLICFSNWFVSQQHQFECPSFCGVEQR